jgi:allantoin racemase
MSVPAFISFAYGHVVARDGDARKMHNRGDPQLPDGAMLLNIVNPNTTASMTQTIAKAARAVARPGTWICAKTSAFGPASIEGVYDDAYAVPGLLQRIAEGEAASADAHVIACFDDTGLDSARALAAKPVIGIGEAAFHTASLIAVRFSIVTTLSRSIPVIESNLLRYGLDRRCAKVRAADVAVLELDDPASDARAKIESEIERALNEDHADAIVLGCAGMADLAATLSARFGVPVVDGVGAAVALAEGLVAQNLTTSKRSLYAKPLAKTYSGLFAPFSPK